MRSRRVRHQSFHSRSRAALFLLAGVLALLTIGLGTALAEGEVEGPTDPVIVPETETPTTGNPTTTPSEPSTPVTSAPTPAPESAPASSGTTHTSTPSTGTRGSSGGSKGTPTQTNSGVTGSGGSSGGGGSDRGGSGGSSGGGGSTTTSTPTDTSSSTAPATSAGRSTNGTESAAGTVTPRNRHATGGDGKPATKAGGNPGAAGLDNGVSVEKPKHHGDGIADFVPLPGKSKTLYFLLVLIILAIASFVVWTQFRGPRASRRRKAHIDHRVTGAARLTPTERVRARQWSTQQGRRARTARRKAA